MNASPPDPVPVAVPVPRRRRLWPWILLASFAPFLFLGLAAASVLTLDGNAAALRKEVLSAADASSARTRVQFSFGPVALAAANLALRWVPDSGAREARGLLDGVKGGSVGVYDVCPGDGPEGADPGALARADARMERRGWSRLVDVRQHGTHVRVYSRGGDNPGDTLELCLAVLDDERLVVASTQIVPEVMARWVRSHVSEEARGRWLPASARVELERRLSLHAP
jgi:hypothetical protein